jgi:uncharacterized protein YuzE
MEKEMKWDYDSDKDSLYLYSEEEKYKGSINFFGFIIDISENKGIKGIEILEASKMLSEYTETEVSPEMLTKISFPKVILKTINKQLLSIEVDFKTEEKEISFPLTITNPQFATA